MIALFSSKAIAVLPMLAHLAEGQELPKTYGLNIDLLSMQQNYDIDRFRLDLPAFNLIDTTTIKIESKTDYSALKFDTWLFPFLNAFVMLGKVNGSTAVILENVQVPELPVSFNNININIDGDVFGGGLSAVIGGKQWFSSLTASYSENNLDGELSSKIKTWSIMPRVGTRLEKTDVWLTAMYLDLSEDHSGRIDLGVTTSFGSLPPVNFDLSLKPTQSVNYGIGARYNFSDRLNASLELTFGDREHQFLNLNWRF